MAACLSLCNTKRAFIQKHVASFLASPSVFPLILRPNALQRMSDSRRVYPLLQQRQRTCSMTQSRIFPITRALFGSFFSFFARSFDAEDCRGVSVPFVRGSGGFFSEDFFFFVFRLCLECGLCAERVRSGGGVRKVVVLGLGNIDSC